MDPESSKTYSYAKEMSAFRIGFKEVWISTGKNQKRYTHSPRFAPFVGQNTFAF